MIIYGLIKTRESVNTFRILMMMRMPEPPVTGGEIYYSRLRQYLRCHFARVETFSWQMKPYRDPVRYILGSVLKNISLLKNLMSMGTDTIILEDMADSPDLFIFNAVTRSVRGLLRKRIYIVPVVHHLDSPLIRKNVLKRLKQLEEGIFFNSSDGIVVNSQFTQRLVRHALKRDVDTVVAYPGLNVSGLGKNIKVKPAHESKGMHLLFVGYVTTRKGVDILIQALEILVNEKGQKDIVLHIVGDLDRDRNFSQKVKGYSKEAGLDRNIIFHGRISDEQIMWLYVNSDVFVFPSLWEGFGMALAEAASFGLPIVTTDVGAIPYLIKDGINGLLVPPGNAEKLAQAIFTLAKSPESRANFGETNRRLAQEFDWDKSFNKIAALIKKLSCK
jgi:glycosyltransferase involved in cell wall biosynthesis